VSYQQTIRQFDEIIGLQYLAVIHLNDSLKGLGSYRDRHTHIGDGEVGAEAFRYLINDPRLDGIAGILETPKKDDDEDDRRNLALLRSLVA